MRPFPRAFSRALTASALGLVGLLGGCGEQPGAPVAAPETASGATGAGATGAGATEASASQGGQDLLARLYRSVALGPALATVAFSQDVAHLRELFWPDLAQSGAEAAAGAHVRASHVAGSVAVQLAQDPGAREVLARTDTFGLRIHDDWVAAAAQGPTAYRSWCATEATQLFALREQELQAMFDRPLR